MLRPRVLRGAHALDREGYRSVTPLSPTAVVSGPISRIYRSAGIPGTRVYHTTVQVQFMMLYVYYTPFVVVRSIAVTIK